MATENNKELHFHAAVLVSSRCDKRSFGGVMGQSSDWNVFNGNEPEREAGGWERKVLLLFAYIGDTNTFVC